MSKHVNMTGHYKVAGRERQGEGILQMSQKGTFAQQRQQARRDAIESQAGPPPWETTPPNFAIAEESPSREKRTAQKARRKKTAGKTTTSRKGSGKRSIKRAAKAARPRKAARVGSRPAGRRRSRSA